MVHREPEQSRSETTPAASPLLERLSPQHYAQESVMVTIHQDEYAPDGKPGVQELVISTLEGHTLLVKLAADGGMTLRDVHYTNLVSLYLPAPIAQALVFQAYERICDGERWQYEQDLRAVEQERKRQAAQEAADNAAWTPPAAEGLPCCFDETPENPYIKQYMDGFLTLPEYDALVSPRPDAASE